MKIRIFIGSSSEDVEIAEAIQANLSKDYFPEVWEQSLNGLTRSTLENLIDAVDRFDFAVFILSPNDTTIIRKNTETTARDNVIFEIGLFIGGLGRERVFLVKPSSADMHLPTDLLGINYGTFEPNHPNLEASLAPFCRKVKVNIQEQSNINIPEECEFGANILSSKQKVFDGVSTSLCECRYSLCAKTNKRQKLTVRLINDDKNEQTPNVWFYGHNKYGWRISLYKVEQTFTLQPNEEGCVPISFVGKGSAILEAFFNDEKVPFINKHISWE